MELWNCGIKKSPDKKDLLAIPGKLSFRRGQIVELKLSTLHPLAKPVLKGLAELFT